MFLLKTDGQGNEQWRKTFGWVRGNSVQQTVDGGFVVTGYDGDNFYDMFLLKADGSGNEQWRKTFWGFREWSGLFGPTNGRWGFVVTGMDGIIRAVMISFYSRPMVKGMNSGEKLFGLGRGYWVQQTVDGGFVVTGYDLDML